eukprot:gene17134-20373_t
MKGPFRAPIEIGEESFQGVSESATCSWILECDEENQSVPKFSEDGLLIVACLFLGVWVVQKIQPIISEFVDNSYVKAKHLTM